MKILRLTKVIVSTLIIVLVLVLVLKPTGASAEWKQDSTGWWYTEGSAWSVGWKLIDNKWYYFYDTGYMAHDTAVNGYKLGSDGAWIKIVQNSYEDLDKLPNEYYPAVAQKNGDVVGAIGIKAKDSNLEKLDNFIEKYKTKTLNIGDMVRVTGYTDEGGAIINDLVVDIDDIRLINDNTRDGYAGTDRGRKEYKVMDLYKTYENNFIYYHAKTEQSRDILLYCYYTLV